MPFARYRDDAYWMKLGVIVWRYGNTPTVDPLAGQTNEELTWRVLPPSPLWTMQTYGTGEDAYTCGVGYDYLEQPLWPYELPPTFYPPPAGGVWSSPNVSPAGPREVNTPPLILAFTHSIFIMPNEYRDYFLYYFPVRIGWIRAYKMVWAGGIVPLLFLPLLSFAAVACTASSSPPGRRRKS